jgi:hypothetical protein
MTIKLPKSMRGFAYDQVMPVDFNTFDVDLLLPSLFFKVVTDGQSWGRRMNDPTKMDHYVTELAQHEDVSGFEGEDGRRVLDRLVRTTLIQIGWKGTSRTIEQIEGVNSYSLLAFRPEFPSEHSRMRRVDALIYRMMRDQFRDTEKLYSFFRDAFGQGAVIQRGFDPKGWYDGKTDLDTLSRLSIAYIDGFESTGVRKAKERQTREVLPSVAERMARDLRRYLEAYRSCLPTEAFTYHIKALINFSLLVYTLKLFYAVSDLVQRPDSLPPAMQPNLTSSPPEIFLDFTGSATGLSRQMASACVREHLESISRFVHANIHLRQLDRYIHRLRGDRRVGELVTASLADDDGGPEYLQSLLHLLDNDAIAFRIDAASQNDEDLIRRENTESVQEDDVEIVSDDVDRVAEGASSDFERIVTLLVEGQRTKTSHNIVAWYWSVGGLTKLHGLLTGHLKSRQSWRYAPSNDLLATLVQLAAIDIPRWDKDDPRPQPIGLGEFLDWLNERFGILVDRPPEGFSGPDYVAAAKENLQAMLRRLRQMGVFRDLSDDFTVQRLMPPFAMATSDEEQNVR